MSPPPTTPAQTAPAVQFTRETWKKYTSLKRLTFGKVFGMKTDEWSDVEQAMEKVFATTPPSEAAIDELTRAFGAWKRAKAKKKGVAYSEVLDVVGRNREGFLTAVDEWLYDKRGIEVVLDEEDVDAMRACSLQQSILNLAVARVVFHEGNRAKVAAKAAAAKQSIKDAKTEMQDAVKEAAKDEAKERMKHQLKEWISGFIGQEWITKLATWKDAYDAALAAAIERLLAELGMQVLADTLATLLATSIPGVATITSGARFLKSTHDLIAEKQRLTLVSATQTCSEVTVQAAQAAMEDCGQRLVAAEAKETARAAAQVAAAAVSDFATLGLGNVAINSLTTIGVAMTRLCELKYLVETAAIECHHANEILAATRAAPTPPTIRELIAVCPIVGCHFVRCCSTAVLFDDFVLAAGRFRYFAVGEVLPCFDHLRKAANRYCDSSLLTIERAPLPVEGPGEAPPEIVAAVEPVQDLIPEVLPSLVATLFVVDNAIDEAVESVIGDRDPDAPAPAVAEPQTAKCLELERLVAEAVAAYKQTLAGGDTVTKGVQRGRGWRPVANVSAETAEAIAYFESADFPADLRKASTYRAAFLPMQKLIGKLLREAGQQTLVEDFSYSSAALRLQPLTAGGRFAKLLRDKLTGSALLPKQAKTGWF